MDEAEAVLALGEREASRRIIARTSDQGVTLVKGV
jgi:hypothetical protein